MSCSGRTHSIRLVNVRRFIDPVEITNIGDDVLEAIAMIVYGQVTIQTKKAAFLYSLEKLSVGT